MNQIFHDDCLNILRDLPDNSIDAVITDPPYLLDLHGGGKSFSGRIHKLKGKIEMMSDSFDLGIFLELSMPKLKKSNYLVFCSNKQISSTMSLLEKKLDIVTLLCWHKTNSPPLTNGTWKSDLEYMIHGRVRGATFNKGDYTLKSKIYTSSMTKKTTKHPAEKPIGLIKKFIQLMTNEGDTILDPFAGSFTTAISCLELNRKYICIEKDKEYFQIGKDRIAKWHEDNKQKDLFSCEKN